MGDSLIPYYIWSFYGLNVYVLQTVHHITFRQSGHKTICSMRFVNLRGVLVSTIGISTSFKLSRHPTRCMSDVQPLQSSVSDLRKEYSDKALLESDISNDPYILFQSWFDEACKSSVLEPNAMCLSTCKDNKPSVRIWTMLSHLRINRVFNIYPTNWTTFPIPFLKLRLDMSCWRAMTTAALYGTQTIIPVKEVN